MKSCILKLSGRKWSKRIVLGFLFVLNNFSLFAQDVAGSASTSSQFTNPVFLSLLAIIILLLLVIMVLANVVKITALNKGDQEKSKREKENYSSTTKIFMIMLLWLLPAGSLFAQAPNVIEVSPGSMHGGLDGTTFYGMLVIICFEILIVFVLYKMAMQLLGEKLRKVKPVEAKVLVKKPSLIEKLNASVAIEQEADILLDHNYDGIRELDNNLPPWWKYGFYATIIFAMVYLVHFHVSKTGKLQIAEYDEQLSTARIEMEAYRKQSANLVDENNVINLIDATSLNSGKNIFLENCAACHGRAGEGGVGPNLTDDFWVHQGGIKNIFKTIKYGWPEKGMKSWQQDLGARQINEVSSYVMSLKGTNPPNSKEKQGEMYIEENSSDSTAVMKTDSSQIALKQRSNE